MKWLDWLLGEPPEPRGLYCVPGIPRPVPSRGGYPADADGPTARELPPPPPSVTVPAPQEVVEGRRGTHTFPEVGLPEGFQPPSAALAAAGAGPQHTATQALWFTPRQLREAARKGGITVRAETTGDYLTLVWVYGVPEGTAPDCCEAAE